MPRHGYGLSTGPVAGGRDPKVFTCSDGYLPATLQEKDCIGWCAMQLAACADDPERAVTVRDDFFDVPASSVLAAAG